MLFFLRQSTAAQGRTIGPFVDDTNFEPATGLTIANTDVQLSKNGASPVVKNSGGGTHIANGTYSLTFDATDTNTVGHIKGSIFLSGNLVGAFDAWVFEEAVYDALFASSAPGYLQPTVGGRTLDVNATGEAGIDWANVGGQGSSVNLSATTTNLVNTTTTNTDMRGTDSAFLAASAPANFSSLVITAGGAADTLVQGYLNTLMTESTAGNVATNIGDFYDNNDALTARVVDDVGVDPATLPDGASHQGTSTASSSTTLTLQNTNPWTVNDTPVGQFLQITDGAGIGQARLITSFVVGTEVATVDPAWDVTPTAASAYIVWATPPSSSVNPVNSNVSSMDTGVSAEIANKVLNAGHLFERNTATSFFIEMVDSAGLPLSGLIVTPERSIDSTDSFSAAGAAITEVGSGGYRVSAVAADHNGQDIIWRFTAAGAVDLQVYVRTYVDAT